MFRRKRAKEEAPAQTEAQAPQSDTTYSSSGGYVTSELPTFHGRQRRVVVYTSDANGKIIKKIKKG